MGITWKVSGQHFGLEGRHGWNQGRKAWVEIVSHAHRKVKTMHGFSPLWSAATYMLCNAMHATLYWFNNKKCTSHFNTLSKDSHFLF